MNGNLPISIKTFGYKAKSTAGKKPTNFSNGPGEDVRNGRGLSKPLLSRNFSKVG
jgi:hypothetical protein